MEGSEGGRSVRHGSVGLRDVRGRRVSGGGPAASDLDLAASLLLLLGGLLRTDLGRETRRSSMRMELEMGIQIGRNP